jgi:hypothetical protein
MSRYQRFKKVSREFFIEAYEIWKKDKAEFFIDFFILSVFTVLVGFVATLFIWGAIAGSIDLYGAVRETPMILIYILGPLLAIAAIPAGVIFLGKHFKANQE